MEVKFHHTPCACLKQAVCQVQNQEQTQEVRLAEAMPDIGRVLGCWGQVLIRGKEWRAGGISVSGGVMAWVLYSPEDGSQICSVETWIPFQIKWDMPQTQRDGNICAVPFLKAADARSTSARKLMVRVNVSVLAEALEPVEEEMCNPGEHPEDVELLVRSHPAELPRESGEKLFQIEEELQLPGNSPAVGKILHYSLVPKILEHKVMAGRLVFRGKGLLQLCYATPEGVLVQWRGEIPFSQFAELDMDHSINAEGKILPVLTGLEFEQLDDRRMQLRASVSGQYVVFDRVLMELVEDAYSPVRAVSLQKQDLQLPVRLDRTREEVRISGTIDEIATAIHDITWLPEHPEAGQDGDVAQITVGGTFTVLYTDGEGNLQNASVKADGLWQLPSDYRNKVHAFLCDMSEPECNAAGQTIEVSVPVHLQADVYCDSGIPMVTEITLGEMKEPEPNRPSLILRRAENDTLWQIAKKYGSTVDAIKRANQITEEPQSTQMLLIPVS